MLRNRGGESARRRTLSHSADCVRPAKWRAQARLKERSNSIFDLRTPTNSHRTCLLINNNSVESSEVNNDALRANCRPRAVAAGFRDKFHAVGKTLLNLQPY